MPFLSKAQNAWGHTPAGIRALGGKQKVNEWQDSTDYTDLPERSSSDMEKKNWIQGAVKHPGALTAAAKKNGVSKMQEAEKESHSNNPKTRGRGILGMRFMKGKI